MNKRLYLCRDNITTPFTRNNDFDVLFILETNLAASVLPDIKHFTAFADPNTKSSRHGGIALYIRNNIAENVFDISYKECYISFRFDFAPEFLYDGVYIQPENSKYFKINMFAELDLLLHKCTEWHLTPYVGGDFNSRLGDLNLLGTWKYNMNVDTTTNKHGRSYMMDVCKRYKLYPVNHLKYKNRTFEGDFTYYKNDKRSQIDFALTNDIGRKHIKAFKILDTDWHISDHRPLCLSIRINCTTSSNILLTRAEDLNYDFPIEKTIIKRFNKRYDSELLDNFIRNNKEIVSENIMTALHDSDTDLAITKFEEFMK